MLPFVLSVSNSSFSASISAFMTLLSSISLCRDLWLMADFSSIPLGEVVGLRLRHIESQPQCRQIERRRLQAVRIESGVQQMSGERLTLARSSAATVSRTAMSRQPNNAAIRACVVSGLYRKPKPNFCKLYLRKAFRLNSTDSRRKRSRKPKNPRNENLNIVGKIRLRLYI